MQEELEKIIGETTGREVKLHGRYELKIDKSGSFTVGYVCVKGVIQVTRPDIIIDGSDAEIYAEIKDCTTSDWSLFFIHPTARNVQFKNLRIRVYIQNPSPSTRTFSLFYNTAYGVKFENCFLEVYSEKQINMVGIYNNGNLDTHMETRADNLVINDSFLKLECVAEEYTKESGVYGIYNYLANSITVQNTFVYARNIGKGSGQKAVGVYTNGRFGRYIGNNIKANGSHNKGAEKEQAHAYGFINEGLYSIITGNNIVGEWGGKCVGLQTNGEYTIVQGNKILSTHTICGRSIISKGNNSSIEGNVLTSTSRNARLIEHDAENCIVSRNIMEVLMAREVCQSGCGIYAVGENCRGNIITENVIRNVTDTALFLREEAGKASGNEVNSFAETVYAAGPENRYLIEKLDERRIRSAQQ